MVIEVHWMQNCDLIFDMCYFCFLVCSNIYSKCTYCQFAKNEKDKHLHYLVDLALKFLPPLPEQAEENIDVGQDDLF